MPHAHAYVGFIFCFSENHKGNSFMKNVAHRDNTYDEEYWTQLASVIDQQKERMWDAMISGFEKYSHVLKERSTLIDETDSLRQQVRSLQKLYDINLFPITVKLLLKCLLIKLIHLK